MTDDSFAATRFAVHAIGEHILAAARYAAVQRIRLDVVPGGFSTPAFGPSNRRIGLINGRLIVRDDQGEQSAAVTTLRAAGEFAGVAPGAPDAVYQPLTPCNLDDPIELDPEQLRRITDWYELANAALMAFRDEIVADDPSPITLWPEHFDVAFRAADTNYGGLAGDDGIPAPYLYVGPDMTALSTGGDRFWNQPFGAAVTIDEVATVSDAQAFFHAARDRLRQ